MQRKHVGLPRGASADAIGNQKYHRGASWKSLAKNSVLILAILATILVLLQLRAGSRVGYKNAANIGVTIRTVANQDLGRKATFGRIAGVVDERLVQEAVQRAERRPGVQVQQALQNVPAGKEVGPRPNQDSVGDIRQAAREQAAINTGAAGVGMTAAEAELVAVGREPPPPAPDEYELAIEQATREKDTMRVQALQEAREQKLKAADSLGRHVMQRASKLFEKVIEGRKQLETDPGTAGGTAGGTAAGASVLQAGAGASKLPAELVGLDALQHVKTVSLADALGAGQSVAAALDALPAVGSGAGTVVGTAIQQPEQEVASDPLSIIRDPLDEDPLADETTQRRSAVKKAMAHSWAGYVKYAWGMDELQPVSKSGANSFCGLGATIVDSLDTLWIMDMKQEFQRGVDWVRDVFTPEKVCAVSVFETIIRVVGGLLAAYELSGDPVLLKRCEELAQVLSTAFATPMGFPQGSISLKYRQAVQHTWVGGASAILSELGSVQLEFLKLSQLTGNASYGDMAEKIIHNIHKAHPDEGLLPIYLSTYDASASGKLSMGALADSYYEYLLKVWLLKGRAPSAELYRSMWEKAMDDMRKMLVRTPEGSNLTYVGDTAGPMMPAPERKMEHLTCFIAGNLALGVQTGAVVGRKAEDYMDLAKALTYTCYQMYVRMPTGLSPEYVELAEKGPGMEAGWGRYNILRPEVVESIFMLWRITGDEKYKEWGWTIFQAFQKWAKVETGGYSGHDDVTIVPPNRNDKQESFWLAETLKYLYLLYSPTDVIPLTGWVFNTEAHPLKVMAVPQTTSQEAVNIIPQTIS